MYRNFEWYNIYMSINLSIEPIRADPVYQVIDGNDLYRLSYEWTGFNLVRFYFRNRHYECLFTWLRVTRYNLLWFWSICKSRWKNSIMMHMFSGSLKMTKHFFWYLRDIFARRLAKGSKRSLCDYFSQKSI